MGLNTKCIFHGNDHPDYVCSRYSIGKNGPTAMIVNKRGVSTTPELAEQIYGLVPAVVFLRDDGWSMGAPKDLEEVAKKLWKKHWVAFAYSPFTEFQPFRRK